MSVMVMLQQVCGAGAQGLLNSATGGSKLSLSLGMRDGTGFYRFLTVLGSTEGERLAGRATFLTPRRNVFP